IDGVEIVAREVDAARAGTGTGDAERDALELVIHKPNPADAVTMDIAEVVDAHDREVHGGGIERDGHAREVRRRKQRLGTAGREVVPKYLAAGARAGDETVGPYDLRVIGGESNGIAILDRSQRDRLRMTGAGLRERVDHHLTRPRVRRVEQ